MDDLNASIAVLDDATAERLLGIVARHRLNTAAAANLPLTADRGRQLAVATEIAPVAEAVSNGELARRCLLLLAAEPSYQPALRAFVENPPAPSYDPLTVVIVGAAALAVLQTRIQIDRDPKGKWTFHFSVAPPSDPLLKSLIAALCGYLSAK